MKWKAFTYYKHLPYQEWHALLIQENESYTRLEDVKFKQKVYILLSVVLPNWLECGLKYLMNGEDSINLLMAW